MAVNFSDENIVKLFGHEEAEREEQTRLIEYFVKNNVYSRVRAPLRLRILVGYKGVGKSALFKICELEDSKEGVPSVWIKPDDIIELSTSNDEADLNVRIRNWKNGIQDIVFQKMIEGFGNVSGNSAQPLRSYGAGFLQSLITYANTLTKQSLAPAKQSLVRGFLNKKRLVVYLDDLDRDWTGSERDILKISALLNATRDIIADTQGLYIRIALRSDVYNIVRSRDASTDKIEGDTIWMQWSNDDIFRVLVKRIATFLGKGMEFAAFGSQSQQQLAAGYLNQVFEPAHHGVGLWENRPMYHVILSLVRAKPRDIILLCSAAARSARARNHDIIHSSDLQDSLKRYSEGRVRDVINEFRSELPDIERLIYGMKPSRQEVQRGEGNKYTTDKLVVKLNHLIGQGKFVFFDKRIASANDLVRFLFKITFVTARRKLESGFIERKYFDQAMNITVPSVEFGYEWEIHPAYRWGLDPGSTPGSVSNGIELTDLDTSGPVAVN